MTVYENMAFGLRVRRTAPGEIDARVREAARILEISHLLDRRPAALSGGQKQRVAIGSVIVRKPKAYLMDEPLSNLDAKLRAQMRVEIAKLHKQLNATIIYVTHDQVEAMTLGTRIVVMNQGMIQQVAPPAELYRNPVNKFVAGFIGSPTMNFLDVDDIKQLNLRHIHVKAQEFSRLHPAGRRHPGRQPARIPCIAVKQHLASQHFPYTYVNSNPPAVISVQTTGTVFPAAFFLMKVFRPEPQGYPFSRKPFFF